MPLRFIGEQLGATVNWEGAEQKIIYTRGADTVILWVDRNYAMVNGRQTELDVPPKIVNSSTVVPLRFIINVFGFDVKWDNIKSHKETTIPVSCLH